MNASMRYHNVSILLHWVMALLIIGMVVLGYYLEDIPSEYQAYMWHKSFGVVVLLLAVIRLFWRLGHTPPAYPATMKPHEKMLAKWVHWGFYVLIIAMPLSGWLMVSASQKYPTMVFNWFELPHLPVKPEGAGPENDVHEALEEVHEIVSFYLAVAMVGVHVLAALKHQFLDKDNLLARMKPRF